MLTHIILFIVAILIMLVGLAGEVLPGVPGGILILLSALLYGTLTGFSQFGVFTILVLVFIWLIAVLINYVFVWLTSRHLGISWYGLAGAIMGAILGLFLANILGLLIGATLGSFIVEYIYQRHAVNALKACGGVVIGFVIGSVLKIVLAITMILVFVLAVIF